MHWARVRQTNKHSFSLSAVRGIIEGHDCTEAKEEKKVEIKPVPENVEMKDASEIVVPKKAGLSFGFMKKGAPKAVVAGPSPSMARVRNLLKKIQGE
jgi:hypothetical protein